MESGPNGEFPTNVVVAIVVIAAALAIGLGIFLWQGVPGDTDPADTDQEKYTVEECMERGWSAEFCGCMQVFDDALECGRQTND